MRLVYLGTPQFAVPTLERIVEAGLSVSRHAHDLEFVAEFKTKIMCGAEIEHSEAERP